MHDDLDALAKDELYQLNLLLERIGIPDDIAKGCITSGFSLMVYGSQDVGLTATEGISVARADFEKLCGAAPNVSRECLQWLSFAFTLVIYYFNERSESENVKGKALGLMNIAMARGAASALLPHSLDYAFVEVMAQRTKMLSEAGARGARAKNRNHAALKKWALDEAKRMREPDIDIARKLANRLPAHLADVSPDPKRFIYDTLRAAK